MGHDTKINKDDYQLPEDSFLATSGVKISAALAGVGLLLSAWGAFTDPARFGYSYLFGFFAVLTLVFGAMFLVLIQHMTAGHWGVTSRRIIEVFMAGAVVVAALAVPFLVGVGSGAFTMYDEWRAASAHASHGEGDHGDASHEGAEGGEHSALPLGASVAHAQDHGEGHGEAHEGGHQHTPQEVALHHSTLEKKVGWLNTPFWFGRALFYLLAWCLIAGLYFRWSTQQDEAADKSITPKMQNWSYLSSFVFGLTLTFAAFDWLMSLEPTWYSTIFGVVIFGGSAMVMLAVTCLLGIHMYRNNLAKGAVNVEHIHDLSRLMFGFICFWTYVQFSQWMLIWYAGIPEEATWFHRRWQGGYEWLTLLLIFGHFVAPFYLLISRVQKRNLNWLRTMCVWLVGMHVADIYWFVMPQVNTPAHIDTMAVLFDIGALLFCGGVFFTFVFKTLGRFPLVPVGDPRLSRSLHHHQSY